MTIEERLKHLEEQVAQLKSDLERERRPKDWRRTVGMFTGDEAMKRIDEAALCFREADRARARGRKPQAKK